MADFATPADFKILKFKGVNIMQDNNQDNQRKIYIRNTKQWVPVTEEVYREYYRPTLINNLLTMGSKQKDGIKEINKRYEEHLARHEILQQKRKKLSSQIGLLGAKRIQITAFLRELDKLDGLMKEFDPLVFQATVNYMKVNSDCTVNFVFRDGTELSWTIQNGVRKYAKRKKGDCDVSAQIANQEE